MLRRITKIEAPEVRDAARKLLVPGVHVSVLAAALNHLSLAKAEDPRTAKALDTLLQSAKTKGTARALCAAFHVWRGRPQHTAMLAKTLDALPVVSTWVWPYLKKTRTLDKTVLAAIARHAQRTRNITSLTNALDLLTRRKYADLIPTLRKVASRADKKDRKLAELAYNRLARMPDQLKTKELHRLLTAKPPWLNLFAAGTLRRRDDGSGMQRVLELVDRPGAHRAEAIRVLGGFRNDAIVGPLIEALRDPDTTVRTRGYAALGPVLRGLFPYRRFDLKSAGYSPTAARAVREAAVRKIHAWWDANKG